MMAETGWGAQLRMRGSVGLRAVDSIAARAAASTRVLTTQVLYSSSKLLE